MRKFLGDKVLYNNNTFKSNINTENINSNYRNIPTRNIKYDYRTLDINNQKSYHEREMLVNNSIHLGHKNISNYKKGLDCLMDALLLNDCHILFKSTGNFSMFCQLFNKNIDELEIIELNEKL